MTYEADTLCCGDCHNILENCECTEDEDNFTPEMRSTITGRLL